MPADFLVGREEKEDPVHTRVKICGITRSEDAILAEKFGADAIGVVMHSPSVRTISMNQAEEIFSSVGPFISRVVVTHTQSLTEIREILRLRPDVLQISHGFPQIRGVRLIRVLSPEDPIRTDCDAVIIDGSRGRGIPFDRLYAEKIQSLSSVPVILAGGLTPDTIQKTVRDLRPYAVDVCSGVERVPGIKDPEKTRLFIQEAQAGRVRYCPPRA